MMSITIDENILKMSFNIRKNPFCGKLFAFEHIINIDHCRYFSIQTRHNVKNLKINVVLVYSDPSQTKYSYFSFNHFLENVSLTFI